MNRTGAGELIKTEINKGKLFIGESAGAILLAPNIEYSIDMDDPKSAPQLENYDALNVIDFYPVPHYRNYPLKKAVNIILAKYETKLPLIPFRNCQAILIQGTEKKLVSSRKKGKRG